jgi:hypothetical protein
MKKHNGFLRIASMSLIGTILAIASCKDEDRLTGQDTQDINEEATTDTYFQDMDDMAGVTMNASSDSQLSGGRVAASTTITIKDDDRLNCSGITVTITPDANSVSEHPQGVILVDFGTTGCMDNRGNVRTGQLKFTYNGRRFQVGSTITVEAINYTVNGIKLEGIRSLTNVTGSTDTSPKFNAVLTGGKATFPDGQVALRASNITWQWDRGATAALTDDVLTIDPASASGKTRGGRAYTVTVLTALKYKRFCGMAVAGVKKYVLDQSKEVTIDYGDGSCDKSLTITVNGAIHHISVN